MTMADVEKMELVHRLRAAAGAASHATRPELVNLCDQAAGALSALIERVKVLEGAWPIATDGPHAISDHRLWLARQLMDSKLSEAEAYDIVRHSPALSNATGGEGNGLPSQPRSDGTVARLNIDAEPSAS